MKVIKVTQSSDFLNINLFIGNNKYNYVYSYK